MKLLFLFCILQMKHGDHYNEESWSEEAMMYIPYIGSSYDGSFMS